MSIRRDPHSTASAAASGMLRRAVRQLSPRLGRHPRGTPNSRASGISAATSAATIDAT